MGSKRKSNKIRNRKKFKTSRKKTKTSRKRLKKYKSKRNKKHYYIRGGGNTNLPLSIFLGGLGVDRMASGCWGSGAAKLFSGFIPFAGPVWWLTDIAYAGMGKDYPGCGQNLGDFINNQTAQLKEYSNTAMNALKKGPPS